jgi:hypothetical protein
MRQRVGSALAVLVLLGSGLFAGGTIVPAQITQARYIALGYDTGDSFLSEEEAIAQPDKILPADLQALKALRDQLESWDKYVITLHPREAELVFAVRSGRRAVISAGIPLRGSPAASAGPGQSSYGGQISSSGDMLTVYDARSTRSILWRERQAAGFPSQLFDRFKADVERSPSPKKKKP